MKEEFVKYFQMLGLNEPIQDRIRSMLQKTQILFPEEEFTAVAINDYVEKDGTRIYNSLRFYSQKIGVLASDFLDKDNIMFAYTIKDIEAITIKTENYDFVKAEDKSRISIIARIVSSKGGHLVLQGTGQNCDYLMNFAKKYLFSRFRTLA